MLIRQRECHSYYGDVHYYVIICPDYCLLLIGYNATKKMNMFIFRRSRIEIESQSNRNCNSRFSRQSVVSNMLYSTVTLTLNFDRLIPRSEAFICVAKLHQCCKFGENSSNRFQDTVITMLQDACTDARNNRIEIYAWPREPRNYVGRRHKFLSYPSLHTNQEAVYINNQILYNITDRKFYCRPKSKSET